MPPVPPTHLAKFQEIYAAYLRAPGERPLPEAIPPRRSRVYEELLFNNVCGFIDRCFPVARKLLTAELWLSICRQFYRDWQCQSPYFSRIPWEFVQFVTAAAASAHLPPWLAELLDYEWRELEVDLHPAVIPRVSLPVHNESTFYLNPTLQNLQYHWPVQRIRPEFLPAQPQPTFLLVYRAVDHQVRFTETNAITALLLQLLEIGPATASVLLERLAAAAPNLDAATLFNFGKPLLNQLLEQNIVLPINPALASAAATPPGGA